MKTFEEIVLDWNDPVKKLDHVGILLGIDGVVQYVLHTYSDVYDLLTSGPTLEDASSRYTDGNYYVDVNKDGQTVDTYQVPEIVWALLLSNCEIIEVARYATSPKTYEEMGPIYYVEPGWTYTVQNGTHEVSPPTGWAPPVQKSVQEQYEYYQQLVESLELFVEKTTDIDEYYITALASAKEARDNLLSQLGE
jgi:hypothetical protein